MRRMFPTLVLFAGLGAFISCKDHSGAEAQRTQANTAAKAATQPTPTGKPSTLLNPFDRYLDDTKRHWDEPLLVRFASECQVDLNGSSPRYAQRPDQKWNPVKDFSHAQDDQETDFYGTVAVWHAADRILVDEWGMELDTGDYYQTFFCLERNRIAKVDSISWKLEIAGDSSKTAGWGFEHRWKLGMNGKFQTVSRRFIDLREQSLPEPAMDADTRQNLNEEGVGMHTWKDLELPDALLH